ncbi:MAG: hypothetical protein QHC79_09405 [Pseudosphingobacterium sp.]|nr:hypothetical protein [Pseudosphingobacterium sp.]
MYSNEFTGYGQSSIVPDPDLIGKDWLTVEESNGRTFTIEKTKTNGKEWIGNGWHFYVVRIKYGKGWGKAVKRIKDTTPEEEVRSVIDQIKKELIIRTLKYGEKQ